MKENDEEKQDVDRLRKLPEGLLFQILLNLPTKDVVRCSVLSSWWRNLWKFVPGLDLDCDDFPERDALASFIDGFLGFNLQSFKLRYDFAENGEVDVVNLTRWINTVIDRKVQHLHVLYNKTERDFEMEIPQKVHTCESLVSLKLCGVILADPKFVSLPFVKVMVMESVLFITDCGLGMLISGCPLLRSLTITESLFGNYFFDSRYDDLVVAIDAPQLEYLKLSEHYVKSFVIQSPGSLVEVDVDVAFDLFLENRFDPDNLNMICNFVIGISTVRDLVISSHTLEGIYESSRCQRLPLFPNLTSLRVKFGDCKWEKLPIFLESCPNLKSLVVVFRIYREGKIRNVHGPQCFLPSLEFVEIKEQPLLAINEAREMKLEAVEMKLVSYLLEKSTILKKLTLSLDIQRKKKAYDILKKLLTVPTLSPSCQVEVF